MKKLLKKIHVIFLCFVLITSQVFIIQNAIAQTFDLNGWQIINRTMSGATRVLDGTKSLVLNGANVTKTGVAKLRPSNDLVAKAIGTTGAVVAVDLAIKALIGAVDYVMDPANSQVRYMAPIDEGHWCLATDRTKCFSTSHSAAMHWAVDVFALKSPTCSMIDSGQYDAIRQFNFYECVQPANPAINQPEIKRRINVIGDPVEGLEERTIPYSRVATEIIDQADSGNNIASDYVAPTIDNELEKSRPMQISVENQFENGATDTDNVIKPVPTDPTNPTDTGGFELPAFCNYAPIACEFYQKANIAIRDMTDFFEWAKEEPIQQAPDPTATDVQIEEKPVTKSPTEFDTNHVTFGSTCPTFSATEVMGVSIAFNLQPLCDFAVTVRPAIIAMSYLAGLGIVVAAIRES